MTTLIIISLVIFLAYVVGTCLYFGIPASISDTYYKLEKRKKGLGWLFTAMCWLVGGLLLPALLEITPEGYQFTAFLACAGLLFVGAAPQFKVSSTGAVHYGSAAVCVVFSQIWVILSGLWWVSLICFVACLYPAYKDKKWMFWIEIVAIVAVYVTILIM